jgi:hypothetical protein
MKRIPKLLVLTLGVTTVLFAQGVGQSPSAPAGTTRLYATYQEFTLSTSAAVLTVQQPTSAPRQITFEGAVIYCSVACVPSLEINGTVATVTAVTPIKMDSRAPAATSTAYTGSDSTGGAVVGKYSVSAGGQIGITKSGLTLGVGSGVHQNVTIRTDAISGTVHILLMWSEPQ